MKPGKEAESATEAQGGWVAAVDRLNGGIGSVIRWLVLAMVLVGAYNALARYVTRYVDVSLTSNALIDLQWYLFSLIFLLGAAYALRHDAHVRVDVVYSRLATRGRAWVDFMGTILFLLPFSVLMLVVSYPAVRNSWVAREVSPDPGGLVRYPIKAVILVSFGLLVLQGLAHAARKAAVIRGGRGSEPGPARPPVIGDVGWKPGESGSEGVGPEARG